METAIVYKILSHGEMYGEDLAIIANDKKITYSEFNKLIRQAASYMKYKGVKSGDRVILEAFPSIEFIGFYFATHLLNAISVPLDINFSPIQIEKIKKEVDAQFIFTFNKKMANGIFIEREQISGQVIFDEKIIKSTSEADIIFTSGTTGKPKGVVLSHLSMLRGAENIIEGSEMKKDTVNLLGVPIHHAFGLGTLRALLLRGATVVLINGFSSLKTIKRTYEQYNCNAISIVPSAINIINELCKGRLDFLFGSLRYFEFGSASITMKMLVQLRKQFPNSNIYASYGSTESPRTMYVDLSRYPDKISTIGKPVSNVEVKVVDDNFTPIQSSKDNIGRVCFNGEMNSMRYWRNEGETRKSFRDTTYISNDLGYVDEDGFVMLVGRINDVLNIGGKKIPASKIENIINIIEGVKESACIGICDENDVLGEVPYVFVVLENDSKLSEKNIIDIFTHTKNLYIKPKKVKFLEKLPLNRIGKIDKLILKEMVKNEKQGF